MSTTIVALLPTGRAPAPHPDPAEPPGADLLPVGVIVYDAAGVCRYANPAAARLFGLSVAALRARNLNDSHVVVYARDGRPLPVEERPAAVALRTGEAVEAALIGVPLGVRPGGLHWLQIALAPQRAADGTVSHVIVTLWDVSGSKAAQDALQQRDHDFATLVEHAPDVIARFDRDLRHVYANPAIGAATGVRPAALLGKRPSEVAANAGETERLLRATFETGEEQVQEFSYRTLDGDRRWQMRLVPERGPDGTVVSVVTLARDITDRHRAEEALRAGEQQFRAVFQAALDAMVVIDDAGVIVAANPAAARAAGLAVEGLEGRAFLTLLPGGTGAAFHQRWTQSRQTRTLRGAVAVTLGDGAVHHFEYQIDPAFLPGRHLVVARDVTERHTTLDALRSSEERFRHVARATGEIFWDWDVANDSVYLNEALATRLGYAPADLAAPNFWSRHLHPEDRARMLAGLQQVIDSPETTWEAEYRIQRADGSYAYMLDRGLVTRDATGRAVRMVGAMIDLTARRAAEDALRRSEARFATAFHGSPFALGITRLSDSCILDVNDQWVAVTGFSRDAAIGRPASALRIWRDPAARDAMMAIVRRDGRVRDFAMTLNARDGTLRDFVLGIEVLDVAGEPCMLIMMRDVTEEKRRAAEARIAERSAALGRVAAGVAHEFNNVLAVIMGRLDLLALNTVDPEALATLQPAQQAAADGAAMVRRIQSFARAHTGRDLRPVALAGLVQDVLAMTRPQWATPPDPARAGIGMAVDVPPGLRVRGDATELREVLLNLVLNAVDALPAGGAIRIGAERRADHVVLTVRDTGCGMDAATQARLFTPFFTTKPQGTGLGLAVVKEIVLGHGGQVRVISAPGAGSTFEITLPADPGLGGADPAPAPEPTAAGQRVGRVLAIDDDPGLARMLQQMLAAAGHEVVTAAGGLEGLACLADAPFDVICTDLSMPGMNGWEVAQRARALAPHVAIVLVTGWDVRIDAATLAQHAIDYVLPKPFRLAAVHDVVARALAGAAGARALHDAAG